MGEILNLGYYNPEMRPDDQVFIKPNNLRDFDKFYNYFFNNKNSIRPNDEIWFFDVDKGIEAWMKYNFLMGVHLMDLQKRNIIPIVSLYEDDIRELGLNKLN